MIPVDIKTLFLTYSLVNVLIVILFTIYILRFKVKTPIIKIFIIARISGVFAITFMTLRDIIPDFLSIIVGNFLLLFSLSNELYCLYSIDSDFNKTNFKRLNIIPLFIFLIFYLFISSPENTRIIISSISIFLIYSIWATAFLINKTKTKIQNFAGYLLIFASIFYFIRFVKAIFFPDNLLFSNDLIQVLAYYYILFLSFSLPILFLFILKEKDTERIANDYQKLEELNKGKNRLFSIIAHDLRGPIGGLQQIGELLWKNEETNKIKEETRKKFTEIIYKSSKKTVNLLDNLLKWASLNSGAIKVMPIKIDLKELIIENVNFLKSEGILKNIEISHNLENNSLVFADINMVNTIIRNLISNALKFTPNSGKIDIVGFNNEDSENYITIIIKDNGVGMSKENSLKVLKIDSSISTLGTENETGTGFGLKLCSEFVVKNNGKIHIESEKNKGTSVFLSLPKYKNNTI